MGFDNQYFSSYDGGVSVLTDAFNYESLLEIGEKTATSFTSAEPFPHAVIDDFLLPGAWGHIQQTFPPPWPFSEVWKAPDNRHTVGKRVLRQGPMGHKESMIPRGIKEILWELNSGLFLRFLEQLSSIEGLLPDPHLAEAGPHVSTRGGFLDIHADFSHHDVFGLERRLNLILFVHPHWEAQWGGFLNLYGENLEIVRSVEPRPNRCVVFATDDLSFHGFPEGLTCPEEVERRSIAMYYYTLPRPDRKVSRILFPSEPEFTYDVSKQ